MTLRTSSAVMTRNTPGIFFAAAVSTDLMRPCGTVERKILPCSMPGSRIRCVYSARPVTFSRASSRGIERPIWPPPIGLVGMGDELPAAVGRYRIHKFRTFGHESRPGIHYIFPLINLHTGVRDGDHLHRQ